MQPGEAWGEQAIGPRVLVLGEGRGAHTAMAFALFYPEQTAAIATIGPAPCVVPSTEQLATPDAPALPFPYGVDDLEQYVGDELETEELREVAVWMGLVPNDDVAANTCPWGALAGRSPSDRADLFLSAAPPRGRAGGGGRVSRSRASRSGPARKRSSSSPGPGRCLSLKLAHLAVGTTASGPVQRPLYPEDSAA